MHIRPHCFLISQKNTLKNSMCNVCSLYDQMSKSESGNIINILPLSSKLNLFMRFERYKVHEKRGITLKNAIEVYSRSYSQAPSWYSH